MSEPTTDRLRIRRARPEDLPAVGSVTVDAYVDGGHVSPGHGYVDDLRDAALRHEESELWVADLDGEVVGSVTFCPPGSPQREVAADGEGEFRMLSVKPSAQGRGVARALVQRCFDRCRELGLTRLAICSMPQMTAAHKVYRTFGFRRVEELDWSPVEGVVLWGYRADVQ